jgi:antitoxin HicB
MHGVRTVVPAGQGDIPLSCQTPVGPRNLNDPGATADKASLHPQIGALYRYLWRKLEYAVRIERLSDSDGGGYLATVPDLPGCVSDGETPEEALKNVQEAIESWIEAAREWKQDIPKPTPPLARVG